MIVGHKSVGVGPRGPRSSSSSLKSVEWSRGNGRGAGARVGVGGNVGRVGGDGTGDGILEGDIKCGTCGKVLCIKKLLYYHGKN